MAYDDEDDLFDEEFDFVDEEDSELEDSDSQDTDSEKDEKKKPAPKKRGRPAKAKGSTAPKRQKSKKPETDKVDTDNVDTDNDADESGGEATQKIAEDTEQQVSEPEKEPGPPADHVIHLYEFGDFTRTLPREFTKEEAEAFAAEYNRTALAHSRQAFAAPKSEEHAMSVTQPEIMPPG